MKNKITESTISLIKEFEGFSPVKYTCPSGNLTIGYGHVMERQFPNAKSREAMGIIQGTYSGSITEQQASSLLKSDLMNRKRIIDKYVKAPLTQGQFSALISLIYNVGWFAFYKSKGLAYLNIEEYEQAKKEFFDENIGFVYVDKKKSNGLINRRKRERDEWNS